MKRHAVLRIAEVVAVTMFMLIPSTATAGTESETGNDCAIFEGDPYYCENSIVIEYLHWDISSFGIVLYKPNGQVAHSWNPARNYPNTGHIYYSLSDALAGKWKLVWESTTSGTGIDYAVVGYYEIDYGDTVGDPPFGNTTTLKASSFKRTMEYDSGYVMGSVSFEVWEFDDWFYGYPALNIYVGARWEDSKPSGILNYVVTQKVIVKKVWWDSGVYGPSYGSNGTGGSIDKSQILFLNSDSPQYAARWNLTYPNEDQFGEYIGDWVIAAFSAMAGPWGFAIASTYIVAKMACVESTSGSNPEGAGDGLSDVQGSALWNGDGSHCNATNSNAVILPLKKGDASYCFEIKAEFVYYWNMWPNGYHTLTTKPIYLCVK